LPWPLLDRSRRDLNTSRLPPSRYCFNAILIAPAVRSASASRRRTARERGVSVEDVQLKRRKLNDRHSYVGKRNFVSYAHRAARVTGMGGIKRQISRHWIALEEVIARIRDL